MLLIFFFIIAILMLKIRVEVKKINISNFNNKTKFKYDIILSFFLFGFIKIFQFKLNHMQASNLIKKITNKNLKMSATSLIKQIDLIKKLVLKFDNIILNIKIGLENIKLTIYAVAIVSTIIPILVKNMPKTVFKVVPLYNLGNVIEIEFKGISEIKLVHIIYIIIILFKERGNKYGRGKWKQTPNRRTYDYSNE